MRFLCLHGMGTNADVFELQTAPLRYMLQDNKHEFEFVNGSLLAPAPASGIEDVYGKHDEYYQYFFPESADSILDAVRTLADFCESDGPFDGVWGFSQGGTLAATAIIAQEQGIVLKQDLKLPKFKMAIFMSATVPFDLQAAEKGRTQLVEHQPGVAQIAQTTTVHFWDLADPMFPGASQRLFEMCDPSSCFSTTHQAGHGMPSASEQADLKKMVDDIRQGLEQAGSARRE